MYGLQITSWRPLHVHASNLKVLVEFENEFICQLSWTKSPSETAMSAQNKCTNTSFDPVASSVLHLIHFRSTWMLFCWIIWLFPFRDNQYMDISCLIWRILIHFTLNEERPRCVRSIPDEGFPSEESIWPSCFPWTFCKSPVNLGT